MNYLLTNKIVALFMGHTDLTTGKWFPFRKMIWEHKEDNNYFNCSISFVEGAKAFRTLYPKSEKVIAYGEVRKDFDLYRCPWRNRMPLSRPSAEKYKLFHGFGFYGFNSNENIDPIEYVAISGGYRHGDKNNLFPEVAPDELGYYNFIFCSGESWYFSDDNRPEIEDIPLGAKVSLQVPEKTEIKRGEWQEYTAPPEAIRMKMFVKEQLVGYAPYYIQDLYRSFGEKLQVAIVRKNLGAPFDNQFLFKATIHQSVGIPFSDEKYQIFKH